MGREQCQRNRERALEVRRLFDPRKRQALAESCVNGDQRTCAELKAIRQSEDYRAPNRFRSKHHRRAASQKKHVEGNLGDFSLEDNER